MSHRLLACTVAWLALALFAAPAHAQSCTYAATGLNFGVIGGSPPPQADTTGTIAVTCSGTAGTTVRVCLSLGSGGATGSTVAQRRMQMGTTANTINFNLYKDAARTLIWGQRQTVPTYTPFQLDIPIPAGGTASGSATVYGRIASGQPAKPSGSYTASFTGGTGGEGRITTDTTLSCSSLPNVPRTRFGLSSSVAIGAACAVTASDINFGTVGSLATLHDGTGQLQAACSLSTPYTIAMDGGSTAANIAARKLSLGGAGAGIIGYQLYRDAARTLVWGNGTTGTVQSGTGNGAAQTIPVYARIPVQATPAPGTYEDTITVTLTY
jgi:spore coat protein U-like protein